MKALITGASAGFGADFARMLSKKGWDLILVARNEEKLNQIKNTLDTNIQIIALDLSIPKNVSALYTMVSNQNIDLLINNAGFGICSEFTKSSLEEELNMIDLNIKAVHILTKLFLKDMVKRDSGRILNVASSAAFIPGPLMSTYYSTKSYVYNMSMAIYEELRKKNSKVKISILCPGPSETSFFDRANVSFSVKPQSSEEVVKIAINKMFKNKLIIIPSVKMKIGVFLTRFLPRKIVLKYIYGMQKEKMN